MFHHTSVQIGGRLISAICTFLTTVVLARFLGAAGFGEYTKVIAYVALFYVLSDFGMNAFFVKMAVSSTKDEFPEFLGSRLLLSVGCSLLACIIALFGGQTFLGFSPMVIGGIAVCLTTIFFYTIFLSAHAVFQLTSRYRDGVVAQGVGGGVGLIVLFGAGFLHLLPWFWAGIVALIVGWGGTAGTALFLVKKGGRIIVPRFSFFYFKKIIKASFPLALVLLFNIVYFRTDVLILSFFRTSQEVGVYGLAYKFFEFALVVPTFFMTSVFPYWLKIADKKVLQTQGLRILTILLGVGALLSLTMILASPFIPMIRQEYQSSVALLQILSFSLPLFFATSFLMWWYVVKNRERQLIYVYGLTLMINLSLNFLILPVHGAWGAAITTGVTEATVLVLGIIVWFLPKFGKNALL